MQLEFEGMPIQLVTATLAATKILTGPLAPGTRVRLEVEATVTSVGFDWDRKARHATIKADETRIVAVEDALPIEDVA